MVGKRGDHGKDLSSSVISRTKVNGTLLGWKFDRIMNYMFICLATIYLSLSLSKLTLLRASRVFQVEA